MLKGSTRMVDRGFTFRTVSFRRENVPNFGRSAVARNTSFPEVVIRMCLLF